MNKMYIILKNILKVVSKMHYKMHVKFSRKQDV